MTKWHYKTFEQLHVEELFDVLKLRQEVFILEQQCIYPDIDEVDKIASHLFSRNESNQQIRAYLRVVPPGIKFVEVSLGRVLTSKSARGSGIGKGLMLEAIKIVETQYPEHKVRISAQVYLQQFYQDLGFEVVSDNYDEDGIPHVDMLRG